MNLIMLNFISSKLLYYELGMDGVKNGDSIGWNLDQGLIEPSFSTCLAENDEPCIVMDFYTNPKHDFDKFM